MKKLSTKETFIKQCSRYWSDNPAALEKLPVPQIHLPEEEPLPPQLSFTRLPDWSGAIGIDGELPVPKHLMPPSNLWKDVDWFTVGFWFLNCIAERKHEAKHGPIHSYSYRLEGWDSRMWDKAWVNRIALFLRRWAARISETSEEKIFGPMPSPRLFSPTMLML